ncbi:Thiol-disulfide isomerase or thioredoxin [Amycolatopsis marina]|uniref:Thiol-disulfide isomerase or thioredoxin n=1 Tax=Amycolatopsis marina TaxID=490629 RepID=A0A1I0VFN6_9PSEU|nr:thioredoxin family protein [Amycolatopsis marina]SFA74857.1 Thiol-disulfide isomerase or thioredoxin [Amycolatopsis marina]
MTGVWVLLGTLAAALAAGAMLAARNGRIRTGKRPERALPAAVAEAIDPAAGVTLVQISTTFCAPCRHTRAVLSILAERTAGLHHVDLDVTQRPEVAEALGVLRTPTTLAFDPGGSELLRIGGVPKAAALLDALRPHLPTSRTFPGK